MKYMILIHSNPEFGKIWEAMTDDEQQAFGRGHFALTDELAASGELVTSEGLAEPAQASWVTRRNGIPEVRDGQLTDGPFAEAKEYLAGFYVVDCSRERAIEWALQAPDAAYGLVEVRPVLDFDALGYR